MVKPTTPSPLDIAWSNRALDPDTLWREIDTSCRKIAQSMHLGELTDDLVQEAILAIHEGMVTFQGKSKFSTWVYRVALNCYKKHLVARRAKQVATVDIEELNSRDFRRLSTEGTGELSDRLLANPDNVLIAREALATLSPLLRETVDMRLAGMSHPEIAKELGTTEEVVEQRWLRALEKLRELP